ncbi:MAG: histidine kinase [Sandaracinaceae bacterium]|nr:histidine kinase [Sandaracinaceae bacterium]
MATSIAARGERAPASFLPWSGLLWLGLTPPLLALLFEPQGSNNPLGRQLGTLAAIWLYTAVVGVSLHASLNPAARRLAASPRAVSALALAALGAAAVSIATVVAMPAMRALCPGVAGQEGPIYVRGLLVTALYVLTVRALVILRRREARERERALEEKRAAVQARWQALSARTHPHFLFTTLNTAISLVHSDPDLAEATLERLASLLRYALDDAGSERRRPLARELEAVRDYLAIEQTRFGDRLRFELHASPEAERALVPPMLVQPLVETAVLYGLVGRVEGGRVEVEASVEQGILRITIEDDGVGPGGSARRGTGTGLSGARERLELAYGDRARLTTGEREGGGFVARLELPASTRAPVAS